MKITMEINPNPQTKQDYVTLHIGEKKLVLRLQEGLIIYPVGSSEAESTGLIGQFGISRKE